MAYTSMLNAFLNVIKFACGKRQKQRTHPRDIDELSEEVHRFSTMLEDHQRCGDVLDSNENLFLDVFSGIDKLQACGIGGLSMQT